MSNFQHQLSCWLWTPFAELELSGLSASRNCRCWRIKLPRRTPKLSKLDCEFIEI